MNEFIRTFKAIAQAYPKETAICVDNTCEISYFELESKAIALTNKFIQNGIKAGHLVAINISKSPEYLIALLATWMSGAAFVPIEPGLPEARRTFFLDQSKPNVIIDQSFHLDVCHLQQQYDATLAYILFTSGSTGQPKGVMVSHAGIVNFIQQQIALFQIGPSDRALWYLSNQFDASISDIGTAFLSGATICLVSGDARSIAKNIPIVLEKNNITHFDIPPSLLATLDMNQIPVCLKTVIIGGEVCPQDVVLRWAKKIRLINVYGPTEATVCTSMECCTDQWKNASIGKPIVGMKYQILNDALQPTDDGELYISGVGLALGYLENPDLTEEKFINWKDNVFYRTGDRVKQDACGNYIYLGRIDRQLKIRGQLIAPEEIEAALHQHPSVSMVAVIFDTEDFPKQLLALVEATGVTANILHYDLNARLPSWMIPNQIIIVDRIPKNVNGKIDFNAIKTMKLFHQPRCDAVVNDEIAQQLQHICKEVLELPNLPSIHDNIIHTLGASSLDIIKIIVCAEHKGLYLYTEIINHLPTIYDLSIWLKNYYSVSAEAISTAVLKMECIEKASFIAAPIASSNQILLTGATGFLGIHLLEELLLNTTGSIICLVRANDAAAAIDKIQQIAVKYHRQIADFIDRITTVCGDIRLPQLGLADEEWTRLANDIGYVYHCAAEVNMVKPFLELKQTNLEGTKEIARFAATSTLKKIHYISTLSVFVATDQNTGACREENSLENAQYVYGGYAQTKWAAEYFLQKSGLDVSIFRPGLITGHSQSGKASSHDYLTMFVEGLESTGSLPDGPWESIRLDATPVDFAAKAIVYLSLHAPTNYYHIVNTQSFSLQMIVHAMRKYGTQLITSEGYKKATPTASMAASYMALCRLSCEHQLFERFRAMDLFQATDVLFDQSNTQRYLENTGISCPLANEMLLDKYMTEIYAS